LYGIIDDGVPTVAAENPIIMCAAGRRTPLPTFGVCLVPTLRQPPHAPRRERGLEMENIIRPVVF